MGQICSVPSGHALSEAAAAAGSIVRGPEPLAPLPPGPLPGPPPPPPLTAAVSSFQREGPVIGCIGDPGLTLLARMGSLSHNPLTALGEAAQCIAAAAGAHAVGISAYLDGDPQRSVLIASYGDGVGAFDENVVMNGPGWAAAAAAPMAGRL